MVLERTLCNLSIQTLNTFVCFLSVSHILDTVGRPQRNIKSTLQPSRFIRPVLGPTKHHRPNTHFRITARSLCLQPSLNTHIPNPTRSTSPSFFNPTRLLGAIVEMNDSSDPNDMPATNKRTRPDNENGTPRRDTTRKHAEDLTDDPDPRFKNATQIRNTLKWTDQEFKDTVAAVRAWFAQHPEDRPGNLRSRTNVEQIQGAMRHLAETQAHTFAELTPTLAERALQALVQHVLTLDKRVKSRPDDAATGRPGPGHGRTAEGGPSDSTMSPAAASSAPPPMAVSAEDITIIATREDIQATYARLPPQLAHPPATATASRSILHRLSLGKLQAYLRQKSGLAVDFTVHGRLGAASFSIDDDDDFATVAVYAQSHGETAIRLSVRPTLGQ